MSNTTPKDVITTKVQKARKHLDLALASLVLAGYVPSDTAYDLLKQILQVLPDHKITPKRAYNRKTK